MERDSQKHSEFSPPSQVEGIASNTDTDKKKRKKTQTDNERVWSRTNLTETKPEQSTNKQSESLATWWHRTAQETKESDEEQVPETEETTTEDQLDHLSPTEVREVAEAYLSSRRQEIAQQLSEQPEEMVAESEAQAALAADAYLAAVENKLRTEPDTDITNVTDEAYYEAVHAYVPESFASPTAEATDAPLADEERSINLEQNGSGGDSGREPPFWRRDGFPPDGRDAFSSSAPNAGGHLETIIERDYVAERAATVRGLLVGGIIGYLIGRRRGRIKTERRLIPIQKKLEREVEALYSTISIKETQLRKLVSNRERDFKLTNPETIYSNIKLPTYSSESFSINQNRPNPESLKTAKPEAAELINQPSSVVEVINRDSLLKAGEKITVGATTLRKVFETGLISERGLRRAVAEYAKGGDIRRILAEELLIKEIGYELDPFLRDRPLKKAAKPLADHVSQLASREQAAATIKDQTTQPADSDDIDDSILPAIPATQRTVPPILITANVIALIVLVILILIWVTTLK
jgi:hypothetical protein